ncbi:RNA polymerase alpha subunit C-terminal domain-containing protein [Niabella ginsengisoli]|uniref:RNA polymerase alpha subunit C-terminal domain-containing protein n=1 Tax=Niabella ginsengisoli TaxID=522298 RepID=A0ABS9SPW0_9BACT|nr:RNA polymerase alpha subunit C-terminal domain-containing protein [Niabella ginsengisoli]MCH5600449.1 RNA polymerase alpha subunit C-terminal domain-containing protein [Niabella ginsengisoli]
MPAAKTLRTCANGHRYYKSSDCPVCPECEKEQKPEKGFLSVLSAPARRALQTEGVSTLNELAQYSEKQILALHGIGKSSLPVLREALKKKISVLNPEIIRLLIRAFGAKISVQKFLFYFNLVIL